MFFAFWARASAVGKVVWGKTDEDRVLSDALNQVPRDHKILRLPHAKKATAPADHQRQHPGIGIKFKI